MHSGKYVFAQLLPFLDRYEFNKCVKRYGGNIPIFFIFYASYFTFLYK